MTAATQSADQGGRRRSRCLSGKASRVSLGLLLAVGLSSGSVLAASAGSASAASCQNYAPVKANVLYQGTVVGVVQVSYNACNRHAWAYLVSFGPPCQSDNKYCGFAWLEESDGYALYCSTPVGSDSCNTGQVVDADITSFASGYINVGEYGAYGHGETTSW